jgi:hypothetical protein
MNPYGMAYEVSASGEPIHRNYISNYPVDIEVSDGMDDDSLDLEDAYD